MVEFINKLENVLHQFVFEQPFTDTTCSINHTYKSIALNSRTISVLFKLAFMSFCAL